MVLRGRPLTLPPPDPEVNDCILLVKNIENSDRQDGWGGECCRTEYRYKAMRILFFRAVVLHFL